jgi:Sulfotransferase domain
MELLTKTKLPDFLIIGAQKAGTTSLALYLAAHPCIIPASCKELHFLDRHYEKGVQWYRSQFTIGRKARLKACFGGGRLLSGDATPYYLRDPRAPMRAHQFLSSARIIIMLRDPVDRAYSQYHHEIRLGKEWLSFEDAIAAENSRIAGEEERLIRDPRYIGENYHHFTYLKRGLYAEQIRAWLEYYPVDQVLIVSSEQMFENPSAEYQRVLKFLRLPVWELSSYPVGYPGKYPAMNVAVREHLREHFAPHNRHLRDYLNSKWPGCGRAVVDRWSVSVRGVPDSAASMEQSTAS